MIDEKRVAVASAAAPGVPDGWRIVRFGDVVSNVDVSVRQPLEQGLERFVGLEHLDPESLHIKRWGLIEEGTSFTRKFVTGQVLFGKRRAYQRKAVVAEFDGICSGDILVFEPKGDELLPELLPFIVQSDGFFEHALGTSAGSLSPRTKWSDLARYEFALPPKDEQRRIADILWATDESYCSWQNVIQNLKDVEQSLLSSFFDVNRINKPQANNSWHIEQLRDCAEVRTGLAKGKHYDGQPTIEMPYLRVANLQDGYLDLTEVKYITVAAKDVDKYLLKDGDVILTEGGDFDKLGRGTVWRSEVENCLHQNHIFCVRPDSDKLLPEFLSYQTRSPYGKQYFLSCSKQTTNLASINTSQVRAFPVLLTNLDEQQRISEVMSAVGKRVEEAESYIENLNRLRKGLCSKFIEDF